MKKYLFLPLMLLMVSIYAQPEHGGIKTSNGLLLYSNDGVNSYTLNLKDNFNIDNYPVIIQNDNLFQFVVNDKKDFGSESKSILTNFMNWEFDHFKNQISGVTLNKNKFSSKNDKVFNHWKVTLPKFEGVKKSIKATYFLDFVHQDYIYRISYSSLTGNDKEAEKLLAEMYNQIHFYNGDLDLQKLRNNIVEGTYYY